MAKVKMRYYQRMLKVKSRCYSRIQIWRGCQMILIWGGASKRGSEVHLKLWSMWRLLEMTPKFSMDHFDNL